MKALLITSDPYEPSGVIGIFETPEQRKTIVEGWHANNRENREKSVKTWSISATDEEKKEYLEKDEDESELTEIEIPIGVFGLYY